MIKIPNRLKALDISKRIFIVVLLASVFSISTAKAQQVIAAGGNHHEAGGTSISWTLGETVIETFKADENIITQGFHQSKLTVVSIEEIDALDYKITAFPNPTTSNIMLNVEAEDYENMSFRLYDFNGRLVEQNRIDGENTKVSLEGLKSGIYFIRIIMDSEKLTTVKIIKN